MKFNEMLNDHYSRGHAEGLAEGSSQMADRLNKLTSALAEQGRIDDIIKAASDPAF